jgi:hypothetical protein
MSAGRCDEVINAVPEHVTGVYLEDTVPPACRDVEGEQGSYLVLCQGVRVTAGRADGQAQLHRWTATGYLNTVGPGLGCVFGNQSCAVDPVNGQLLLPSRSWPGKDKDTHDGG